MHRWLLLPLLTATACTAGGRPDRCDEQALIQLGQDLEAAPEAERPRIVWPRLEAACGAALPAAARAYYNDPGSPDSPTDPRLEAMQTKACPSWAETDHRAALAYEQCGFARHGVLEADELDGLSGPIVTWALHQWFVDQGLDTDQAAPISRALFDLERRPNLAIVPLPDQFWPRARGRPLDLEHSVVVRITPAAIILDGQTIATLQDGAPLPHDIGPLPIPGLPEALTHKLGREEDPSSWSGRPPLLLLAADTNTTFATILEVVLSAGRAGFRRYAFVVESSTHGLEQLPFDLPRSGTIPQMARSFDPSTPVREAVASIRPRAPSVMSIELRADGVSLSQGRGHDTRTELAVGQQGSITGYARAVIKASCSTGDSSCSAKGRVHQVLISADADVRLGDVVVAMAAARGPDCARDLSACVLPDATLFGVGAHGYDGSNAGPSDSRPAVGGDDDDVWDGPSDDAVAQAYGLIPSDPKRVRGTVRMLKPTIKGELDPAIIRRIVRAHINQVRVCYSQSLAGNPALTGRVSVDFVIDADGEVPSASVRSSSLKDPRVGTCVARAIEGWRFPKPRQGALVVVTYPFELELD